MTGNAVLAMVAALSAELQALRAEIRALSNTAYKAMQRAQAAAALHTPEAQREAWRAAAAAFAAMVVREGPAHDGLPPGAVSDLPARLDRAEALLASALRRIDKLEGAPASQTDALDCLIDEHANLASGATCRVCGRVKA
jgi:hypothetical protein